MIKDKNNSQKNTQLTNIISVIIILVAFTSLYLFIEPRIVGYFLLDQGMIPLASPVSTGIEGQTKVETYHRLMNALFSEENVTQVIDSDKLWVPWHSSSSSCTIESLHDGNNCNIGDINFDRNCMVSDEFSQVGMLVAMGNNQTRMNQYYNTLQAIESNYGTLVSWRVARNGSDIIACHPDVNGNCDAASDADARIIISLYTASANTDFVDSEKRTEYLLRANQMSKDFVEYNLVKECKTSNLGYGDICYWLAAGPGAKSGGLTSNDFTYTGYYPDAIIAMLQACSNTENQTYCKVAGNLTLNYFQAAQYDGETFTVPPGMAFKWGNTSGTPIAQCTRNCNPPSWDNADAPRALMLCQANYYSKYINYTLPMMDTYCEQWYEQHMTNPSSAPLQYYQNGTASASAQSSYYAQGLQALMISGTGEQAKFNEALTTSLNFYTPHLDTWSWTSCFGVYYQSFPIRALGFGIGRDLTSFPNNIAASLASDEIEYLTSSPSQSYAVTAPGNTEFSISLTNPLDENISYTWSRNGTIVHEGSNTYSFYGAENTAARYNISVTATTPNTTIQRDWDFRIQLQEEQDDNLITFGTITPSTNSGSPEEYFVNQTITLTASINNPSQQNINVRWNANSSDFDEIYGSATSTTIDPYDLPPGSYKIDAVINSSTNSINHAFYVRIKSTTPQIQIPAEIPSQAGGSSGGGGGGGGAPVRPIETQSTEPEQQNSLSQEETSSLGQIASQVRLASIINSYYTESTEMSAEELILSLRELLSNQEETE